MGMTHEEMKEVFEETKANLVILQLQHAGVYYTKLLPIILRDWSDRLEKERMIGLKSGLEVAKDIMKKVGYDFHFRDPDSI